MTEAHVTRGSRIAAGAFLVFVIGLAVWPEHLRPAIAAMPGDCATAGNISSSVA